MDGAALELSELAWQSCTVCVCVTLMGGGTAVRGRRKEGDPHCSHDESESQINLECDAVAQQQRNLDHACECSF